jgi:SNARE-associated protein Snapin
VKKEVMTSSNSSVTSIDDNTENFAENPTRELLAEGFLGFFSPVIENLDSKLKQSQ